MATVVERAMSLLWPSRARRLAQRVQTMWSVGVFNDPTVLLRQWRHRADFARLQRAIFYHRYTTAVLIAHEVGLFDALAAAPGPAAAIAQRCGLDARAVVGLTRILEAQGLVDRQGEDLGLTPFAALYLQRAGEFSVAPMLDLMAAQATAFAEMPESLRSGRAPRGLDIFSEGGRYREFLGAVNAYLMWAARDLLGRAQFPSIERFLVGSMGVSFSAEIMARFPGARVTYGCLAHLVREIPRLREEYRVPAGRVDGMHAHSGDPADDDWGGGPYDMVLLTKKMILDPDGGLGERFARKALSVLRPGGVAVLWETVHAEDGRTPLPRAMEGVLDLCASPVAPIQTEGQLRRLLVAMGYATVEIVPCLDGHTTFVVARR